MPFTNNVYAERRKRLAELIGEGAIAIIATAREAVMSRDVNFPFHPDNYFHYLTGFGEPDAILVLVGGEAPRSILFCTEKDSGGEAWKKRDSEFWTGQRLGTANIPHALGIPEAYPAETFWKKFTEIASGIRTFYSTGGEAEWNPHVKSAVADLPDNPDPRPGKDARPLLDGMRMIKEPCEIEMMRKAAAISSKAHARAMKECRPGIMEYELEAVLNYEFRSHGGAPLPAYPTIVAGGNNACTLHYVQNDKALRGGDLVMVDAGCEYGGYASDITRTFPINGKFSAEQAELYEAVLGVQLAVIAETKPGVKFGELHGIAAKMISKELRKLGIRGDAARMFPHGIGHFLGADVHDVHTGAAISSIALLPGMVITVEPGIYIPRGMKNVPAKWRGIGIRIEDDVLVTPNGCETLSSPPKTIEEIEGLMS